jgi:hypothetical protein
MPRLSRFGLPALALKFTDGIHVDFDLCSWCLTAQPQNFGSHSKSHSLFAIEEPGGLWVHTIFEGDGTPGIPVPPVAEEGPTDLFDTNILGSNAQGESHAQGELVAEPPIRLATCEFCDTAIRGERFVRSFILHITLFLHHLAEMLQLPRFQYVLVMLCNRTFSTPRTQLCPST